jgi:PhzF family phenazine biosynthesis protein
MSARAFHLVNVFARDGRFTGNPLCVFEDGSGLDTSAMQAIARQFNLSETTFILPSERASAQVRIFTPAYEMPFAGHPTLGTAHVVRALGKGGDEVTLEMKVGVIPVGARGDRWTLTARTAQTRPVGEGREDIAAALGLEAADIRADPLWVNAGTEQMMVPVATAQAVDRALPVPARFLRLAAVDGPAKAYVFFDEGEAAGRVRARFFFPSANAVLEDPATGSACANLGAWFLHTRPHESVTREVSQGEAVARPSTLYLEVRAGSVFVGGRVLELGRGTIDL